MGKSVTFCFKVFSQTDPEVTLQPIWTQGFNDAASGGVGGVGQIRHIANYTKPPRNSYYSGSHRSLPLPIYISSIFRKSATMDAMLDISDGGRLFKTAQLQLTNPRDAVESRVMGDSRVSKVTPFDSLHRPMVSYYRPM